MADYKPEMQLRTDIQLKQQLKLIQTPIMIQRMELLQAPLLEVVKRLKKELEENPALELREPAKIEETGFNDDFEQSVDYADIDKTSLTKRGSDQDQNDFKNLDEFENESTYVDFLRAEEFAPRKSSGYGEDKKLEAMKNTAAAGPTLPDFLYEQLQLQNFYEYQIQIGEAIIYNIDNNGYLRYHLLEIVNNLPRDLELPEDAYQAADERIQELTDDPVQNSMYRKYKNLGSSNISLMAVDEDYEEFEKDETQVDENNNSGRKKKNKVKAATEIYWTSRSIPMGSVLPPEELYYSDDRFLWAAYFEAEYVLSVIQTFEPVGVGTYGVRDCLLKQLTEDLPEYQIARQILEEYFEQFLHQDLTGIASMMELPELKVQEAARSIAMLNPRPGNLFAGRDVPYILPDISVKEIEGEYYAVMEDKYLPGVNISPAYLKVLTKKSKNTQKISASEAENEEKSDDDDQELEKLLAESDTPEVKNFVKEKVQSARTLLDALEQRQITLERVAQVIIERQKEFFKKGVEGLKPLKMQDIADNLGLHVSTISRSVSEKYIETPQGIFPLRYFFRSGTVNAVGEEQSVELIKQTMKDLIDNEEPDKPLSDDYLSKVLGEKLKIKIARRTVAKYRTILGIPSSHKRKK